MANPNPPNLIGTWTAQVANAASSYKPTTFVNRLGEKAKVLLESDPLDRAAVQEHHPDFEVDGYSFWGPTITPKEDAERPFALEVTLETSMQTPQEVSEWMLAWAKSVVDRRVTEFFDHDGGM